MDDIDTEIFISLTLEVKLMRFIGKTLVPSNLTLNMDIVRGPDTDDYDVELALTKWRYWLDHVAAKSIAFSSENSDALGILLDENGSNRTDNLFILTPEEPSDELLAALFQAKFNALGMGHMVILSTQITSDNLHGLSFTVVGDHTIFLPLTVEDWLGPSFWEQPWWHRNDASSIDVIKPHEDAKTPAWAYSLDFLDRGRTQKAMGIAAPKKGFQPTVIDGGKPKDDK